MRWIADWVDDREPVFSAIIDLIFLLPDIPSVIRPLRDIYKPLPWIFIGLIVFICQLSLPA